MSYRKLEILSNDYVNLNRWFGCIESVEELFDFDYSCGNELLLSDIDMSDPLFEKNDGMVDFKIFRKNNKIYNGIYILKFEYDEDYWINGTEEFRNCKNGKKYSD